MPRNAFRGNRSFGGSPMFALLSSAAEGFRLKKDDESKRLQEAANLLLTQSQTDARTAATEFSRSATDLNKAKLDALGQPAPQSSPEDFQVLAKAAGLDPKSAAAYGRMAARAAHAGRPIPGLDKFGLKPEKEPSDLDVARTATEGAKQRNFDSQITERGKDDDKGSKLPPISSLSPEMKGAVASQIEAMKELHPDPNDPGGAAREALARAEAFAAKVGGGGRGGAGDEEMKRQAVIYAYVANELANLLLSTSRRAPARGDGDAADEALSAFAGSN